MEGKRICQTLKAIRQTYAKCYGIEYHPEECHYEGECGGNCKKCDEEALHLQLEKFNMEYHNILKEKWENSLGQSDDTDEWYTMGELPSVEYNEDENATQMENSDPWAQEPSMEVIGISRHRIDTDGSGVRTLIAVNGCPLRCKYCINPHSWNGNGKVNNYSAFDLVGFLNVDELYFEFTGGGVTFGGGEPLLYAECIQDFAENWGQEYSVILETSLYVPLEKLKCVTGLIEQYIVDIKSMNPSIYEAYTGQSDNQLVINNLKFLLGQEGPDKVLVRVPQIPGYTTEADVEASVRTLQKLGCTQIDVYQVKYKK